MSDTPTSSEDSDLAKFAAVAVTGNQIAEGAVKSAQDSRKRQIKAAQRRAGGGGVLGVRPDSDSDDGLLNAAQIKVADALHQRIKRDFLLDAVEVDSPEREIEPSSSSEESSRDEKKEEKKEDDEEDSDGGGVALFKNAPRITKVKTAGGSGINGTLNGPRPRSKGAAEASSDEEESKKRCRAAAVDSDVLIENADKAAEKARDLIMPVNPTSSDEGGKAKKRRRKKLKEEEEARRKKGGIVVEVTEAVAVADGEAKKKKKKKQKKKKESEPS